MSNDNLRIIIIGGAGQHIPRHVESMARRVRYRIHGSGRACSPCSIPFVLGKNTDTNASSSNSEHYASAGADLEADRRYV
jgi:hypothetical protein